MKNLFFLLFAFTAISCTEDLPTEPTYNSNFERLQGDWTTISFSTGWGNGKSFAPKKTPDFTFLKDSSYKYLSIDSSLYYGKFDLFFQTYKDTHDTTWMLKSLTRDSLWFESPCFIYFYGNDQLEIIEDAGDGFRIICQRIR